MAQSLNTNLSNVAKHYIKMLKVPVTTTTLTEKLTENPYYPSLYCISNVFDKFGLINEAYTITEADLDKIVAPFITYCSGQNTGSDFVLVTKITETSVSYIAESSKSKLLTKVDFLRQWHKTVFIAEATAQSGENNFKAKQKDENFKIVKQNLLKWGGVLLIWLLLYMFIRNEGVANIIATASITFIKALGICATILLLIYEVDKTNSFVKNICSAGKQTNCDAVLNSKAAKIFGMAWGEVGFFYFASTTLFLLFPGLSFINKLPWLATAGTFASLYMVFSIYYQWRIVKKWCLLCLAVQVVLAMELIWAIAYYWTVKIKYPFTFSTTLLPLTFCILLIFTVWYIFKPILIAAKAAPGYNAAYRRILYNPEIFNSLLQQQASAPDGWQKIGIDIGNPNATITIIKVCNPYCGPCAKAHPVLEEIIKNNSTIKVKVIFTSTNNENDKANKPVKHLLAIASKENLALTGLALDDWYLADKKEYETFAAKYPVNGKLTEQEWKIDMMNKWCNDAEITGTPTFFINGKRLPETYNIDEIKNIF